VVCASALHYTNYTNDATFVQGGDCSVTVSAIRTRRFGPSIVTGRDCSRAKSSGTVVHFENPNARALVPAGALAMG
jgi:hypothetical protein